MTRPVYNEKETDAEAPQLSVAVTLIVYVLNSVGIPEKVSFYELNVNQEGKSLVVYVNLSPLGSTKVSRSI
jgi:hypothetical protein